MPYDYRYPKAASALHDALVDDAFYKTLELNSSRIAMLCYLDYSMIEAEEFGVLTLHLTRFNSGASSYLI